MSNDEKWPHETPEVAPLGSIYTPQNLAVASFSVAVLLVLFLVYFKAKKATAKGDVLLLVGPSNAGKTALMSKLVYDQSLPTQTSMQANTSLLIRDKKSIRVVDIPGHPRLRSQFQEYIPETKVIAFVVDASAISRNAPEVAEYLHHILHALTSLPPSQHQPALLILAHKSDLMKSGGSAQSSASTLAINRVKTILERELEKRRVTQRQGVNVEGLGEEGQVSEMGGLDCGEKDDSPFKFDEWEGGNISFLATSIKEPPAGESEKTSINSFDALSEWLEDFM